MMKRDGWYALAWITIFYVLIGIYVVLSCSGCAYYLTPEAATERALAARARLHEATAYGERYVAAEAGLYRGYALRAAGCPTAIRPGMPGVSPTCAEIDLRHRHAYRRRLLALRQAAGAAARTVEDVLTLLRGGADANAALRAAEEAVERFREEYAPLLLVP